MDDFTLNPRFQYTLMLSFVPCCSKLCLIIFSIALIIVFVSLDLISIQDKTVLSKLMFLIFERFISERGWRFCF